MRPAVVSLSDQAGFGIVGCPFQPVNQDAVVFYEGLSVFSGTAELVNEAEQGVQHIVDLALAKGIAENRLASPNGFEVIFAYYVREADRILGRYRGVNDEQVPNP